MRGRKITDVIIFGCIIIIGAIFMFCTSANAQAIKTTPKEIQANPDKYDGKMVLVEGAVSNIFSKVSRRGNAYYTFDLLETNGKVKVFNFGKPNFSNGNRVRAVGRFLKENHVSGRVFYNEIDASKGGSVARL